MWSVRLCEGGRVCGVATLFYSPQLTPSTCPPPLPSLPTLCTLVVTRSSCLRQRIYSSSRWRGNPPRSRGAVHQWAVGYRVRPGMEQYSCGCCVRAAGLSQYDSRWEGPSSLFFPCPPPTPHPHLSSIVPFTLSLLFSTSLHPPLLLHLSFPPYIPPPLPTPSSPPYTLLPSIHSPPLPTPSSPPNTFLPSLHPPPLLYLSYTPPYSLLPSLHPSSPPYTLLPSLHPSSPPYTSPTPSLLPSPLPTPSSPPTSFLPSLHSSYTPPYTPPPLLHPLPHPSSLLHNTPPINVTFHTAPAIAIPNAFYGSGAGLIWFDHIKCHGNETSLLHCTHPPSLSHTCSHSNDAGVLCPGT